MSISSPSKEDMMQQQILAAAKGLFQVYGLVKVTMDDVARAIGKGRSSLYYYYKSKDEIFDAVVRIEIHEMLTEVSRAVNQAAGVEQKLRAFFLTKIEVLRQKRAFFRTLDAGMDAAALSDFNRTKLIHHNLIIKQESALLEQLLKEGINKGELRKVPKAQLELLVLVLLSSLRGLKRELELQESNSEKDIAAVDTFIRMVVHGLKN